MSSLLLSVNWRVVFVLTGVSSLLLSVNWRVVFAVVRYLACRLCCCPLTGVSSLPLSVNWRVFAGQLGRTALHYAYLFMDDPEILNLLERHGSSPDTTDVVSKG